VGQRIVKIPLPQSLGADRLRFLGDDLAAYSVSKAYKLICSSSSSDSEAGTGWRWCEEAPLLATYSCLVLEGSQRMYSDEVFSFLQRFGR